MPPDNITLIGMPGSGKSSVGKLLAARLHYRFVDGDDLIRAEGKDLQEIIERQGEEAFLRIEARVLGQLAGEGMVIAPGGSCVMSPGAMEHLGKLSLVVYMEVPCEVLSTRIRNMERRGIVGLRYLTLAELCRIREPLYRKYARCTLSFAPESVEETATRLVHHIRAAC
jgi:shikimate kinase